MSGVRINGKMASYDSSIKNGDIIEIQRSDKSRPTRKWLLMCKTTFAKHHIRKYLREHGGVLDKVLYREK